MLARWSLRQAAQRSVWLWPGGWLARVSDQPSDGPRSAAWDGNGTRHAMGAGGGEPLDAAYEAFIREHQRAILNYLWRMTGDKQSAYDLTQEVFVRAWGRFEKLQGYERPRGWLFRVATNLALTNLRG